MSKYRSFKEAKKFVHSLKLNRDQDWRDFCKSSKKPKDIPADPRYYYKNEFKGMGDWLGTGRTAFKNQKWRSYDDAKKFVHSLKLLDREDWVNYCKSGKKPDDIPVSPYNVYKNECKGMGDWLGTGRLQNQMIEFRTFDDAKKFVHSLKFKIRKEWVTFSKSGKKPKDIPTDPANVYKKEWKGWGDFLGTGRISSQVKSKQYLNPKEALPVFRKLAIEYGLKNKKDWDQFAKTHKNLLEKLRIPAHPLHVYSKENVWRKMK